MPPSPDARSRFLALLDTALAEGTLVKLTLGKPRPSGPDATLRNVFGRPVTLKAGPQISLVYRHATRDVTKNLPPKEISATVNRLLEESFFDAHLFTTLQTSQLEQDRSGCGRLRQKAAVATPPTAPAVHDQPKNHVLTADAAWLRALGVTNEQGRPREGMAHKFRQIEKFAELLRDLLSEGGLRSKRPPALPLQIADMGAGKGYLTFALAALLRDEAMVTGIERRGDLVALGNRIATDTGLTNYLRFVEGDIPVPTTDTTPAPLDVLIALHACDTATDDALAAGHAAGARLLVVSPCCQKELRATFSAPPVLAEALRHGIFQERQAEFLTDALRAQLLECVGYRTKVFEFISTEHTAKNLLIAAHRLHAPGDPAFAPRRARALERTRAFAAFYGVREQRLARHLGIDLAG